MKCHHHHQQVRPPATFLLMVSVFVVAGNISNLSSLALSLDSFSLFGYPTSGHHHHQHQHPHHNLLSLSFIFFSSFHLHFPLTRSTEIKWKVQATAPAKNVEWASLSFLLVCVQFSSNFIPPFLCLLFHSAFTS